MASNALRNGHTHRDEMVGGQLQRFRSATLTDSSNMHYITMTRTEPHYQHLPIDHPGPRDETLHNVGPLDLPAILSEHEQLFWVDL